MEELLQDDLRIKTALKNKRKQLIRNKMRSEEMLSRSNK